MIFEASCRNSETSNIDSRVLPLSELWRCEPEAGPGFFTFYRAQYHPVILS